LVVAIASNRGLAGAFNSNIVKSVRNLYENEYAGKQVDFCTIGKKVNDVVSKTHTVVANKSEVFDDLTFANVAIIAEELMQLFTDGAYDKIVIVYNKFKNAATQVVTTEQFLPIVPVEGVTASNVDYIFEPSKEEIVEQLIPAMHKATDNATELRDSLKLQYNKARQAAITNEILEIVGGAEALNN